MSARISLTLEESEVFLSLHVILSLERAAVVWAILERISDLDPSFEMIGFSLVPFIFWTASSEFGTYRLCEQRRFRRACAVSPEPLLLAHTSYESRGTFRQKARSLAPLNGWACAVKICHDGMLEDTNSLDGALLVSSSL